MVLKNTIGFLYLSLCNSFLLVLLRVELASKLQLEYAYKKLKMVERIA
jgi:hypothetical protein